LCSRCEEEIGADQEWELDHNDWDPSQSYPSRAVVTEPPPTAT
jgi:hypothetical protein